MYKLMYDFINELTKEYEWHLFYYSDVENKLKVDKVIIIITML